MRKKFRTSNFELRTSQKGQTLIVVIFILLVVSLIVLAVSARSITDIRISETSEDSARAFSAAEAGVEEAVQKIRVAIESGGTPPAGPQPINLPNNPASAGTYSIAEQSGDRAFLSPDRIASDLQTFQVYLSNRNFTDDFYKGNSICLMWGDPGASSNPAIEASVIYRGGGQTRVARFPIDPAPASRPSPNNFILANQDPSCDLTIPANQSNLGVARTFVNRHRLGLKDSDFPPPLVAPDKCGGGAECLYLLRARLLYNTQPQFAGVRRHSGGSLPLQGHRIESTGQVGETSRKVSVYRSLEALPAIFDFAIFNGSTSPLSK